MDKIVPTKVSFNALCRAQGGHEPHEHGYRVWVTCPKEYDAAEITADDIVNDNAIQLWEG